MNTLFDVDNNQENLEEKQEVNHKSLELSAENLEKIEEKIQSLRAEIQKYNEYYYSKNESLVSDVEFDAKLRELEDLETKYPQYKEDLSPTTQVGSSLKDTKFQKTPHKRPMLSLANSYNIGDIGDFVRRVYSNLTGEHKDLLFALEVKLDGASISLQYENGVLVRGVTRGDGVIGEDVTENIYAIKSIPKKLTAPVTCEVRGEIVLPRSRFNVLNEKRLANGEEVFANARNAASGTLRQLDAKIVTERGLDAYFYFLVDAETLGIHTHSEAISYMKELGLQTTGICELIGDLSQMEARISYWDEARESLDYDTDGMVIKLDDMSLWAEVGYTTKVPRWAIAYKFPAKQVSTKLYDITWQVGRTGKLTPVAELEEVELSGSRVKRASLHNMDEIIRKDIRIGDRVFIEKAAEIIPQVVSAIKDVRTGDETVVTEPTSCPVCGGELMREEGLVDLKCINPVCPAVIMGTIQYFVSRDGMNIMGLGDGIVRKFLELGIISDVTDIYNLVNRREELIDLDKMGEKSVDNLIESIEASKSRPYAKTLYALGIPFVGKFLSGILSAHSGNIDGLMAMTRDDLLSIEGVGDKVADSVISFFADNHNREIIDKLKSYGVNYENSDNDANTGILGGKTFLFTGKLVKFKRDEVKDMIESLGGKNLSGVSKKLDYLVVGEAPGSKLDKAREIGTITILTEDEFIQMCDSLS